MAGRINRYRKQAPKSRNDAPLSSSSLELKAKKAVQQERYKDAIIYFKRLLKQEPSSKQQPEWLKLLAEVYEKRALQLADKGMFQEALIICQHRSETCGEPLGEWYYLQWLLRFERFEEFFDIYLERYELLKTDKHFNAVQTHLAAMMLGNAPLFLAKLPATDLVVQHYSFASKAWQAILAHNFALVQVNIKQIPFRSPYRDFRQLLSAMISLQDKPETALAHIAKIKADSPFYGLANIVKCVCGNTTDSLQTFVQQGDCGRGIIAAFKGWTPRQYSMLEVFAKLEKDTNTNAVFDFCMRYHESLADDIVVNALIAKQIENNNSIKIPRNIHSTLSRFQEYRMQALICEQNKDFQGAERAWRICAQAMLESNNTDDKRLKAALILRHIAELWERRESSVAYKPMVKALEDSLDLDPGDKEATLKVIACHKNADKKVLFRQSADKAAQRFPNDSDILLAVVESAIINKAYKKAARYAKSVLDIDPINIKVRELLQSSHLNHARKLIKAGTKYELARKELEQAHSWSKTDHAIGYVQITEGLLEVLAGNADLANSLLQQGCQRSGEIAGFFLVHVECLRLNLLPNTVLKQAKLIVPKGIKSPAAVLALIHTINQQSSDDQAIIQETLSAMKRNLLALSSLAYSEQDMLAILPCFEKFECFDLLQRFAQRAEKLWPEHCLFAYYAIYAKAEADAYNLSHRDVERMQDIGDAAVDAGDQRTLYLVQQFMQPMQRFPGFGDFFDDDDDDDDYYFDDDDDDDDESMMRVMDGIAKENPEMILELLKRMGGIGNHHGMGDELAEMLGSKSGKSKKKGKGSSRIRDIFGGLFG